MDFVEEYRTDDKSEWGEGAWQGEPDKVVWVDQATGLDCMAHRGPMGSWCGYVGVPEGHQAYGKGYDLVGIKDIEVNVHGGLTFSAGCQEDAPPDRGICHITQPGRPEKVWWLGFDTGHFMDLSPAFASRMKEFHRLRPDFPPIGDDWGQHYWTLEAVVAEVTDLAKQLA